MSENMTPEQAEDLLDKILSERLPVVAFLVSHNGTQVQVKGFAHRTRADVGLTIATAGPLAEAPAWITVPVFDKETQFSYGDVRLLPESMREEFASSAGDSVLVIRFPAADEMLAHFFTP